MRRATLEKLCAVILGTFYCILGTCREWRDIAWAALCSRESRGTLPARARSNVFVGATCSFEDAAEPIWRWRGAVRAHAGGVG